jgi:hypothetical protein
MEKGGVKLVIFNGEDFDYWKNRTHNYLLSQDRAIWDIVQESVSTSPRSWWLYSTSILAAGGNEVVMVNYFPMALTGTARSWLRNLLEGSLTSWGELCHQFTTNIESAYAHPGNEVDLHIVQQRPGESQWSFIQRFSQV